MQWGYLYTLGLLRARLGDDSTALLYAAELERASVPGLGSMPADLGLALRASVAWSRGRAMKALEALEQGRMEWPYARTKVSWLHQPYLRAQLLDATGRPEEALAWYGSITAGGWFAPGLLPMLIYVAPSHYRRGEIYERLGDREHALDEYAWFVELWEEADPELQSWVVDARKRISELTAEPSGR